MAGNVRKKPGRKSRRRDDAPFLPFSPEDCPLAVPAAGNRNGTDLNNRGSNGNYWSATLNEDSNAFHGIGFLGAYLKPYRNYIHNDSLKRIKEGLKCLKTVSDTERLRASLDSYLGVLSHYSSFRLRKELFCNQHHLFRYGYFGKGVLTFRCLSSFNRFVK